MPRRSCWWPRVAAGELALSLYLDPALLRRLAAADPLERLHGGNVADCLTALEGVSHFLYLVWNASHDRPVSLLELEMQAEVDKFIVSHWLLRRQVPGTLSPGAAAHAVRARRAGSERRCARGDVPRGQRLCRALLPLPGALAAARTPG